MIDGISVFDKLMYAVVKPKSETIMATETTVRHFLPPKATSAKSSYVDLPVS